MIGTSRRCAMNRIEVRGINDGTFIFTVTERDHEPWGTTNTTLFVPPEQLEGLVVQLQARLHEVTLLRQAVPAFASGEVVQISGRFRQGQQGRVIDQRQKDARMEQLTGEAWSYTVMFPDG